MLEIEKKDKFTNLGQKYHKNRKENKRMPNMSPNQKLGLFKTGIYKQPNFTRK